MANIYSPKVDCCEVHGTKTEEMTPQGFTANVTLSCEWSDRVALVVDLVGASRQWPFYNGPCLCVSAKVRENGGVPIQDGQSIVYDGKCLVDCRYSFVTWKTRDEEIIEGEEPEGPKPYRSVTENIEATAQFIPVDYKNYRWGFRNDSGILVPGPPLKEDQAPGKLFTGLTLSRTMQGIETLPQEILDWPGCCNRYQIRSRYNRLVYPPESLMFTGVGTTATYTNLGSRGFDLTLKFAIQKNGWNRFYNDERKRWEEIIYVPTEGSTEAATAYKSYPPVDFGWLLDIDGSADNA